MPSLLPAFQGHSRQYLISQQKNTTSWFQRQPKLFRSKKKLRVDWRRVGKRKLAGLFFMTIQNNVTLAFLEKMFLGSRRYILTFFGIFRPLWPKLQPKKNKKTKRPLLSFSCGYEEHPCQISFSNSPSIGAQKKGFPWKQIVPLRFPKSSIHCSSVTAKWQSP